MKALSIDIGASSGRFIVVTYLNNKIVKEETYRFLNGAKNFNDSLRWDFKEILNEIEEGLKITFSKHKDIKTIGIDTRGCDYCLFDHNDNLIAFPYSYRDARCIKSAEKLLKKTKYKEIYKLSGIQYLPFNTVFQLYDDVNQNKEFSYFLMIPDAINFFLTGNKYIELTNLSTTAMYNPCLKEVDENILNLIGLDKEKIPQIIKPCMKVGNLRKDIIDRLGLYDAEVVSVGSHDTASAIASISLDKDSCYLSSGTWSLLGIELKEPLINKKTYELNFTNEIGLEHTVRFLKNIMGLFIIQELRKDFLLKDPLISFKKINDLASSVEENNVYIDINDELFQTPGDMMNKFFKYLEITNQHLENDIGKIARCVYESMAFKYKEEIKKLKELSKKDIKNINIIGGGGNATLLNQLIADSLNIDVIIKDSEATVLGNSMAQFIYQGAFKDLKDARERIDKLSGDSPIYKPKNVDKYEEKYKNYLNIIRRDN